MKQKFRDGKQGFRLYRWPRTDDVAELQTESELVVAADIEVVLNAHVHTCSVS